MKNTDRSISIARLSTVLKLGHLLTIQTALLFISYSGFAWTNQSTFKIETGADLQYVVAAPNDPQKITAKLPVLVFEEGDGTTNIILNDFFAPAQMVSQLEQASQASGFIWAIPQLRTQYLSGQALQICSLDFQHRERDLERFIDQVKSFPYVDSSKIFLIGHSAGADTVTHVASERNDIHGVINLAGGVSSCSEESADCPEDIQTLTQYQCTTDQDTGRTGDWWKQLFLQSDLFKSISSMSIPYLALIGSLDTVVSVTEFQNYSAQISKVKSNFRSAVLPGLDHGTIKTSPQSMQMMLNFVNQNIGTQLD